MQTFLILLITIFTTTAAQICYKKGALSLEELDFSFSGLVNLIPRVFQNGWLMGGTVLFGVSFLFYLLVLTKFQLNIAYPVVVSAGAILITIASWLLFKEMISALQIMGIIIIILGIYLLLKG